MTLALSSTWTQAVAALAAAHAQGEEAYAASIAQLTNVIQSGATAQHVAAYVRFEPKEDAQMTLAQIAGVFTQDDYAQAVEELFAGPARILVRVQDDLGSNAEFAPMRDADPGFAERMGQIAISALVIELGDQPEDLEQRLSDREAQRAGADVFVPHVGPPTPPKSRTP